MSESTLSQSLLEFSPIQASQRHYTEDEITSLVTAIRSLKNEVKDLMIKQAVNTLQVPLEVVEPAVKEYMRQSYKLGRPPLEGEIKDAITKTNTMKAAAEYLGVSVTTLKRYSQLYEKNSEGGTPLRLWQPTRGNSVFKRVGP
jgi:hypothetical protein